MCQVELKSKLLKAVKVNDYNKTMKLILKFERQKTKGKLKGTLDINKMDSSGRTVVHYAAENGSSEICRLLASRLANMDILDRNGRRPLAIASAANHVQLVRIMLRDLSIPVAIAMEQDSPLHLAAALGHADVVTLLLDHGAQPHSKNCIGKTPFDLACENNHYGVVNILLNITTKTIDESTNRRRNVSFGDTCQPIGLLQKSIPNSSSVTVDFQKLDCLRNGIKYPRESMDYSHSIIRSHTLSGAPQPMLANKSNSLNTVFTNGDWLNTNCRTDQVDQGSTNFSKNIPQSTNNNQFYLGVYPSEGSLPITLPYPTRIPSAYRQVQQLKQTPLQAPTGRREDRSRGQANGSSRSHTMGAASRGSYIDDCGTYSNSNNHITSGYSSTMHEPMLQRFFAEGRVGHNIRYSQSPPIGQTTKSTEHPLPYSLTPASVSSTRHYNSDLNIPSSATALSCSTPHGSRATILGSPIMTSSGSTTTFKAASSSSLCPPSTPQPPTDLSVSQRPKLNPVFKNPIPVQPPSSTYSVDLSFRQWLTSINLGQLWPELEKGGFDNFLSLSLASHVDIMTTCGNRIEFAVALTRAITTLQIPQLDQLQLSANVRELLAQLGIEQYEDDLINNGYSNTHQHMLGNDQFGLQQLDELSIIKTGHRKLILEVLEIQKKTIDNKVEEGSPVAINSEEVYQTRYSQVLPRLRSQLAVMTRQQRKYGPPIPPRSCSLTEDGAINAVELTGSRSGHISPVSTTLEELLSQQHSTVSSPDKSVVRAKDDELEDVLSMLSSINRKLDQELSP